MGRKKKSDSVAYSLFPLILNALLTTDTIESDMVIPPNTGDNRMPKKG